MRHARQYIRMQTTRSLCPSSLSFSLTFSHFSDTRAPAHFCPLNEGQHYHPLLLPLREAADSRSVPFPPVFFLSRFIWGLCGLCVGFFLFCFFFFFFFCFWCFFFFFFGNEAS